MKITIKQRFKPQDRVYFYCLEYGNGSEVLGVTQDWVQEFKKLGIYTYVVTTYIKGEIETYPDFLVETGGGSTTARIKALWKLYKVSLNILRNRENSSVFYHMHHKSVVAQGVFLKAFRVHQTLWYSHAKADALLGIANKFANLVITTAHNAYPRRHRNILSVGQAVSNERFKPCTHQQNANSDERLRVLTLGRVSPAKRIEKFFESLEGKISSSEIQLDIVGPVFDIEYSEILRKLAGDQGFDLCFKSGVRYGEVAELFCTYKYYFTGTETAIDKSAVEAALCGLIVITDNLDLLDRLGLIRYYSMNRVHYENLSDQVKHLRDLSSASIDELSKIVSNNALKNMSIKGVIASYLGHLNNFEP